MVVGGVYALLTLVGSKRQSSLMRVVPVTTGLEYGSSVMAVPAAGVPFSLAFRKVSPIPAPIVRVEVDHVGIRARTKIRGASAHAAQESGLEIMRQSCTGICSAGDEDVACIGGDCCTRIVPGATIVFRPQALAVGGFQFGGEGVAGAAVVDFAPSPEYRTHRPTDLPQRRCHRGRHH